MPDPTLRPPLTTRIFPLLIIAAVVTLFFAPALFFGKAYFFRDLCMEIVPKRQFWADHHGFVLWNPYVFTGEPYAANPQSSAFYPLSWLWLLGPAEVMLGPYLALHFLLAGVFAYLLFLELGLRRSSALAGSLAFILGGGFASLQLQVVNLNSAAWAPGIFWMGIRLQKTGSLRSTLALGILVGLQILGGEPEICYLTLLALFAFLLFHARSGGWKIWPRLLLALIAALGLSAIQWVLTLEMTGLSNRAAGFNLAQASAYSLEARDLISLIVPHVFLEPLSNHWGFGFWSQRLPFFLSIYPGIIVLLLLPVALRSGRRREAIFWTGLALISLWLALGPEGHLYTLAHRWLPGLDRFRFPERALIIFGLALAGLAGLGIEALPDQFRPGGTIRSYLMVLVPALLYGIFLEVWLSRPSLYDYLDPWLFFHSALQVMYFVLALVLILGLLLLASRFLRLIPAAVGLLLVLDLFLAHRLLNPTTNRAFYNSFPAWVQELKSASGPLPSRVYIAPPPNLPDQFLGRDEAPLDFYRTQREWLQPFFALPDRIPDLQAHSSFRLGLFDEMQSLLYQADPGQRDRLLAFCGVGKVAVPGQGMMTIPNPLPRAYLAFSTFWAESHVQALQLLAEERTDNRRTVILEGGVPAPVVSIPPPIRPAEVVRYSNERVEIKFTAPQPAVLVLLDSYYPGWEARVDEKPVRILQANAFFRAVRVPAGRHQVRFEYRPSHWRLAWGLTAGTALLVGLLWIIPQRLRKEGCR